MIESAQSCKIKSRFFFKRPEPVPRGWSITPTKFVRKESNFYKDESDLIFNEGESPRRSQGNSGERSPSQAKLIFKDYQAKKEFLERMRIKKDIEKIRKSREKLEKNMELQKEERDKFLQEKSFEIIDSCILKRDFNYSPMMNRQKRIKAPPVLSDITIKRKEDAKVFEGLFYRQKQPVSIQISTEKNKNHAANAKSFFVYSKGHSRNQDPMLHSNNKTDINESLSQLQERKNSPLLRLINKRYERKTPPIPKAFTSIEGGVFDKDAYYFSSNMKMLGYSFF